MRGPVRCDGVAPSPGPLKLRLVDTGWNEEIAAALRADHSTVRVVCPFIKQKAAARLLEYGAPKALQIITRFDLAHFSDGVSDTAALRLLLESGAQIRGIRHLHAKVYLLGRRRVIVCSANLTEKALLTNHEFGFVSDDSQIVRECRDYFEGLWAQAGPDLSRDRLAEWEAMLSAYHARGAPPAPARGLPDEGIEVGRSAPPALPSWVGEGTQAFVKFFGEGHNRAPRSKAVFNEVKRSGSHWACTYPKGRRPRRVEDGAVMFMGRMVSDPNDILVYGRAVGKRHEPGSDDASRLEIRRRPWKDRWPHYVRVHHAEFVAGTLSNGVSLNELMEELGENSFAVTQRHARTGYGNTNPRRAYLQQPAVELSPEGRAWLNTELEESFSAHGQLTPAALNQLDRPR